MSDYVLHCGDALQTLRTLASGSVQMCCTSPPYFGLRSYLPDGHPDKEHELGAEETPEAYVSRMVDVFREVRRVLHHSGVLFLNIGDSYAASSKGTGGKTNSTLNAKRDANGDLADDRKSQPWMDKPIHFDLEAAGLKPKDLIGIPWLLAFALRADGWYLRQEIIWHKLAPMPESVTDRCTKAHEQVFLLAKSREYYFDAEAIREPIARQWNPETNIGRNNLLRNIAERERLTGLSRNGTSQNGLADSEPNPNGRNKRSVWTLGPEPYSGSHYAVMPSKLVEPCILAGTSARGCCATCGAPWERILEPAERVQAHWEGTTQDKALASKGKHGATSVINTGSYQTYQTVGWQPTCQCNADIVPCTVLDPFYGSGTVGAVALKHGRRFVGIDLDARNLELAHKRIQQSQPLLLEVTA